jgi:hypothetical protein
MSTKNLARTAIEGGRHKGNKWDRRNSHAEARAELRDYLKKVRLDEEFYYEADAEPTAHVGKSFDDKLGPMYRWLGRQVGRLWDEVRADIASSFDIRTTAGRHIIFDHLLRSVQITPEVQYRYYQPDDPTTSYSRNDFYVDEEGILCKKRYLGRRHPYEKVPHIDTNQLCNWLNGRIVGKVGNKLFWFEPTTKNEKRGGYRHIWKIEWGYRDYYSYSAGLQFLYLDYEIIYKRDSVGHVVIEDGRMVELERKPLWKKVYQAPALRQDRKLNDKEVAYWSALPKFYRNKILEQSPNYVEPKKP